MTHTLSALFQQMQELGYSQGCCTVTPSCRLPFKRGSKGYALVHNRRASEGKVVLIEEFGRVCNQYGINEMEKFSTLTSVSVNTIASVRICTKPPA